MILCYLLALAQYRELKNSVVRIISTALAGNAVALLDSERRSQSGSQSAEENAGSESDQSDSSTSEEDERSEGTYTVRSDRGNSSNNALVAGEEEDRGNRSVMEQLKVLVERYADLQRSFNSLIEEGNKAKEEDTRSHEQLKRLATIVGQILVCTLCLSWLKELYQINNLEMIVTKKYNKRKIIKWQNYSFDAPMR